MAFSVFAFRSFSLLAHTGDANHFSVADGHGIESFLVCLDPFADAFHASVKAAVIPHTIGPRCSCPCHEAAAILVLLRGITEVSVAVRVREFQNTGCTAAGSAQTIAVFQPQPLAAVIPQLPAEIAGKTKIAGGGAVAAAAAYTGGGAAIAAAAHAGGGAVICHDPTAGAA